MLTHANCIEACVDIESNAPSVHGTIHGIDAAIVYPPTEYGEQLVVFRGTLNPLNMAKSAEDRFADWCNDFQADSSAFMPGGRAHDGLLRSALELYAPVLQQLDKASKVTFCGHSKGGAMAILTAMLYQLPCSVVTFGAPRCLDEDAVKVLDTLPIALTCYEAAGDVVPHVPLQLFGEYISLPSTFIDVDGICHATATMLARMQHIMLLTTEKRIDAIVEAHGITLGHLYWQGSHNIN